VEYLLGHKAVPSQLDRRGYNALHYAAAAGHVHSIQHLLDFGGSELFFSRPMAEKQLGEEAGVYIFVW
jgi:ankyrin repeat protein